MESYLDGIWMPIVANFASTLPGCESAVSKTIDTFTAIFVRLGTEYFYRAVHGGGQYQEVDNGRHYSFEYYNLEDVRACSTTTKASALCASSSFISEGLKDLLDIDVVNNKCVPSSRVQIFARGKRDSVRAPSLDSTLLAQVASTHACHMQRSIGRCPTQPASATCSPQDLHSLLENSISDPTVRHFVTIPSFSGSAGAGWSAQEICNLAMIQDSYHHDWNNGIINKNWETVGLAGINHQIAHVCMNLSRAIAARVKIRPSCGDSTPVASCPVITCTDLAQRISL
jgi:hypothetical protein